MKNLTPRTAKLLILRKATQHRSERAMKVIGALSIAPAVMNDVAAQWCAIATANMFRKPFRMRQIDQAVCVVRRNQLVSSAVLIAAGFNPGRP